ncbi:MAG: hypothetical protein ABI912_08575 [Actinomycetota bacterium]
MTDLPYPSLEAELRSLAPVVEYPRTPDLASAVAARLRAGRSTSPSPAPRGVRRPLSGRRTGLAWWPRVVAQAALALLALAAVVLIASPAARAAVANIFRKVPGIRVIVGAENRPRSAPITAGPPSSPASVTASETSSPAPSGTPSDTASASPSGTSPSASPTGSFSPRPPLTKDFGTLTTLAAARARVPYTVRVPASLGRPDAVYFDPRVGRGMVTMRWRAGAGLPDAGGGAGALLTQFDTANNPEFPYFLKELAGSAATFEQAQVNGGEGGWIEGAHQVQFAVPREDDVHQVVSNRLAANTLIWLQDGVTMRLETALSRDAAVELAETIR